MLGLDFLVDLLACIFPILLAVFLWLQARWLAVVVYLVGEMIGLLIVFLAVWMIG